MQAPASGSKNELNTEGNIEPAQLISKIDQELKKNGIDIEKEAYEFSEDAYKEIASICTAENAEKMKQAA